jgi:hypothetical protein
VEQSFYGERLLKEGIARTKVSLSRQVALFVTRRSIASVEVAAVITHPRQPPFATVDGLPARTGSGFRSRQAARSIVIAA